jgi:hypothetical protein
MFTKVWRDFHEMYSPTIKYDSIRIVLAIAAQENMEICQFDIKTEFLHGELEEEVYMVQVFGFEDPEYPNRVCYLHKALYRLRQASQPWYLKLNVFLTTHKFKQNYADNCVYFYEVEPKLIVTIFINGGLCCCQDPLLIDSILHLKITNPDLYIGLNIERDHDARLIFIHQCNYLQKILRDYGFDNSMEVAILADSNSALRQANTIDTEFTGDFPFTNVVGSLQWAGLVIRPDILFSVSNNARFKAKPTKVHCNISNLEGNGK